MRFFYFYSLFFLLISHTPIAQAQSSAITEEAAPGFLDLSQPSFADKHIYHFMAKAFDQTSQFILIGGAASALALNPQDDQIRREWKGHQKLSKSTAKAGDLMGSGAVGILALGSQYFFDENQDHWVSHARALVWSTVFSSALKVVNGRPRPGNSDSHHSFPSGHTTTAFTTATSLTYAYGWKAAAIAYPVATLVGLSRLSDDVHWGSDVVAGAFLGFWAARASFYSDKEVQDAKQNALFTPILGPDELGVRWVYSF